MLVKVKKFNEKAILPTRMTKQSAGFDLYACIEKPITILYDGGVQLISTGIGIQLPEGYEAQIRPRSGLALKYGVTVLNAPGTIDADYRNEIKVILINHSQSTNFTIENGMRIAQMVIAKHESPELELVDELNDTERGTNGFGSTGTK